MVCFDDITTVKDSQYPVKDYCSFINLFQTQVKRYKNNTYIHYEVASTEGKTEVKTLTYAQVDLISTNLACDFHAKLGKKSVISLLDNHSVHYIILLYAFYKLRVPIQLISPRNSPTSVFDLLRQMGSDCLVYGESYQHIKNSNLKENIGIEYFSIPDLNLEKLSKKSLNPKWDQILDQTFNEDDLDKSTIIVHSSGTTNSPKAIIWNNRFLLYYVQAFQHSFLKRDQFEFIEDQNDILIGITPAFHAFGMYSNHHGILSGGSMYFFKDFPPTAKDVIKVIKREKITRLNAPPYFVSRLIQHMEETQDFQAFQNLKLVITAGAATPKSIDEFYSKHKIKVSNMFAMSESFNLLSSDPSEQRVNSNTYFFMVDAQKHCYFEHYDDNRFQLIVKSGSPFLAVNASTRENGDYATKDLFAKSKDIKDGYNYAGRADDTLIMVNGEKTNPLPMEDIIKSDPLVANCTVIGEGQHCTAVLIELDFEVSKDYCHDTITEKVHESVKKANQDAPDHSVILEEMVKIIPLSKHLIASDKGTVSRKRSIAYFKTEVDAMYTRFLNSKRHAYQDINSNDVEKIVKKNLIRVLNPASPLKEDVSLFKQGLNSLLSIQLQNYLSKDILPVRQDFPYDYPTITSMVDYFTQAKIDDKVNGDLKTAKFDYQSTTDILNKYLERASIDLTPAIKTDYKNSTDDKGHVVVLTGATGSLGAAVLLSLLKNTKVKTIYALVRGNESTDLMGRIAESFKKRGYPEQKVFEANRIKALPMNLEQEYLGFSHDTYNKLKSETTMILLCAWLLDFNQLVAHYDSECLKGFYNMVKFANKAVNPIHLHYISSVSATGAYGANVPEKAMPNNPQIALPIGYSQSKFIVEQLFKYFLESKNMPCYIYRVGQLCGDSTTGTWNTTEMYPLTLMGGGTYMKKMPNLETIIDWIPVDVAGKAISELMINVSTSYPKSVDETIFHIVNPNEVDWLSLLDTMKKFGMEFDIIEPASWVLQVSKDQNNPCYKLLGFYEKLFIDNHKYSVRWESSHTQALVPSIKEAPTVNDKFSDYLKNWKKAGFFD